ncbi:MAG: hypothetical protein FGM37_05225, partial [Phycisphaerales bacterium]|nr:hypothetical protein [Phycisphaerales bacterium]
VCTPRSLLSFAPPSATVANGNTLTSAGGATISFTPLEGVIFGTDTSAPALNGVPDSVTSSTGTADSPEIAAFIAAAGAVTATDNCTGASLTRTVTLPGGTTQQSLPPQFSEGVTSVTWIARDASGNQSAPQTRTVTVNLCQAGMVTFYPDGDGDGFGRDANTIMACATSSQPGYVTTGGDCDDANDQINPGATEACNGVDDDCDGAQDEGALQTFFRNFDGDGFGDSYVSQQACSAPTGYVAVPGDCDDMRTDTYPGAPELCDGRDNDCNSQADDGLPAFPYHVDADRDGYGTGAAVQRCEASAPDGYSSRSGDNCPDSYNPSQADCDDDGTGDACAIAADPDLYDCDGNGVPDTCQLADDPNLDTDGNGIIDACQGPTIRLTTASSAVEPDGYFYVDLSEIRFDTPILAGSFRVSYSADLIDYIELEPTVHYSVTLIDDTVQGSVGELRFSIAATGVVATTPEVILARILVKAVGGPVCVPTSMMEFHGGEADNTISDASGPIPGNSYDLYAKAMIAFDVTAPVLDGVPADIYAYAGGGTAMEIPRYLNADVSAFDSCGAGVELEVDLRVTLPGGIQRTTMPSAFPLGMSVVRWRAVDAAGNVARATRIVEVVTGPPPQCAADLDSTGDSADVVDGQDLSVLLGSWGATGIAADINGDGIVDSTDLTYLLGAWGPCR